MSKETRKQAEARRAKLKIPKGYALVPLGHKIREGDMFRGTEGWQGTSDWGRKVCTDYPNLDHLPRYAGVYIRKIVKKVKPFRPEFQAWKKLMEMQITAHEIDIHINQQLTTAKREMIRVLKKSIARAVKEERSRA